MFNGLTGKGRIVLSFWLMVVLVLLGGISPRGELYAGPHLNYSAAPVIIEGLSPGFYARKALPGDPAVQIAFRDFFGPGAPTADQPSANNIVPPFIFSLPPGTELAITALPILIGTTTCSFLFWSVNLQTSFNAHIDLAFLGDTSVTAWYECVGPNAGGGPSLRIAAFDLQNSQRLDGVTMVVRPTGQPGVDAATVLSICRLGGKLSSQCPDSGTLLTGTVAAPASTASAGAPDLTFEEWAVDRMPVRLAGGVKPVTIGLQAALAIAFYKPPSARLTVESNLDGLVGGLTPRVPQLQVHLQDGRTTFSSPMPLDALRPVDTMLTLSGDRNFALPQTPSGKPSASYTFDSIACDSASGPVETSIGPGDTSDTWERVLASPTIPPVSTFHQDTTCRIVYTTQAP